MAIEAAKTAGKMIFDSSQQSFEVFEKEGTSITSQVVTEVDFKSERLILDHLQPTVEHYDLGLLTEETTDDHSRLTKSFFWCIDPLDGTLPFTESQRGYAVSIALVNQSGETEIGVVNDPVDDITYSVMKGLGLLQNGEVWKSTERETKSDNNLVLFMDRSFRNDPLFLDQDPLRELAKKAGYEDLEVVTDSGGVMNAISVLHHQHAAYFKFPRESKGGGSIWDYAATSGLYKEAGFPAIDLHGDPLHLNSPHTTYMHEKGILFASNQDIAKAVREFYLQS